MTHHALSLSDIMISFSYCLYRCLHGCIREGFTSAGQSMEVAE